MKKIYLFILIIFSLLFVGCAAQPGGENSGAVGDGESNVVYETTRKIYYVVNMTVSCDDVNETINKYTKSVDQLNGYISNSNINGENQARVTFRVPTEKLDSFLLFIDNDSDSKVTNKNISTTDITSNYDKISARLEVLHKSREAYVKFLEQANTISEIISINTRIEEIDTEILQLENQKSSYDNLLDYSTIIINFNIKESNSFFDDYFNYLGKFFLGLGIAILYLIPFGIIIGLVLTTVFVIRKVKKNKKNVNNQNIV